MGTKQTQKGFRLEVPLDASGIKDLKSEQAVKVLVETKDGARYTETVTLDRSGTGTASFTFPENPGNVRVFLGPESAEDDKLLKMQTINVDVPARQWRDEPLLVIPPLRISPYYWHWWWRWCRTFTIRGKVVCPDGRPVPGAKVCASDVDFLWWWSSSQMVGCATTDINGAFEIEFQWCCGWWPWWWWRHRFWQLEPKLIDHILPVLRREPKLRHLPPPTAKPSVEIFQALLPEEDDLHKEKLVEIKPALFEGMRERLLEQLPVIPELQHLHIWPWWPWRPWWDCTPDIIFRVTQDQAGNEVVIVDEDFGDTRWNIPTTLNVQLTANNQAWCVPPGTGCTAGNCVTLTYVCDDRVDTIAGNIGTPIVAPAGYKNPGLVSVYGDRPYAGVVPISGTAECMAGVDYYEFEWSDDGGGAWNAMPPAASGAFSRSYIDFSTLTFSSITFAPQLLDGRYVYKTLDYYEATHPPANWGSVRYWVGSRDRLIRWLTHKGFSDGVYHLRVVGYDLVGGALQNRRVLKNCGQTSDNYVVVRIDNRTVSAGPTDTQGHPCGSGTVHTCTTEPDTGFMDVRILHTGGGVSVVGACGKTVIKPGDRLQVDFMAHDPDGHLAKYTLRATYGVNQANNLLDYLGQSGVSLAPMPGGPVPAAMQVGPTYAQALGQGATSPTWKGGSMRLIMPADKAFPKTCCYQLELRGHKRTIVSCNDTLWGHTNYSEYSFLVEVAP